MNPRGRAAAAAVLFVSIAVIGGAGGAWGASESVTVSTGGCRTQGIPSSYPYASGFLQYGQAFDLLTTPAGWYKFDNPKNWLPNSIQTPSNLVFTGAAAQLKTTRPSGSHGAPVYTAGIGSIETSSGYSNEGGRALYAWCARFTNQANINTAMMIGQPTAWPPEIDFAEGANGALHLNIHWTVSTGTYNGNNPSGGKYTCNHLGRRNYNCRARYTLTLPPHFDQTVWHQYGAVVTPSSIAVYVDGIVAAVATDGGAAGCFHHIVYDNQGRFKLAEHIDEGTLKPPVATEPCIPRVGNGWEFNMQQQSDGGANIPTQVSGLAWYAQYTASG